MARARSLLLTLTLALLCASPLAAQDAPPADDAKANTQALLAGMTGLDESLLGTYRYGVHVGGAKNIGTFNVEVLRAPEGSGAVYQIKVDMVLGAMGTQGAVALLDAQLGLIQSDSKDNKRGVPSETSVKREGEEWVRQRKAGEEEPTTLRLPVQGPDHAGLPIALVLCRKLDLSKKSYLFSGSDWKATPPAHETIAVSVEGTETLEHRGEKVEVTKIVAKRSSGEVTELWIDAGKNILQLGPVGAPIRMFAGTAEEITRDLPRPEAKPAAGSATPKEAVALYFRVIAKSEPVDALDKVMDWEAIRQEMFKGKPEIEMFDAAGVAKLMKEKFSESPAAVTQEQVDMLTALLTEEITGETAKVVLPGKDDAFGLRKTETGWLITHFPH